MKKSIYYIQSKQFRAENRAICSVLLLVFLLVCWSSTLWASKLYVGESFSKNSSVILNFFDVPTNKNLFTDEGNIAALKIEAHQMIAPSFALNFIFPAYHASENATGRKSEANIGNLALGAMWTPGLASNIVEWGVSLGGTVFLPTARQPEAESVAYANPTTDFYQYLPYTLTVAPQGGLWIKAAALSAKANLTYAFEYISKESFAGNDQSRQSFQWQTGASWHVTPGFNIGAEYNAIQLDTKSSVSQSSYRHAAIPSIGLKVGPVDSLAYVVVPLDEATQRINDFAVGLKAGFIF